MASAAFGADGPKPSEAKAGEVKYETNYRIEIKKAVDEAKKSRAMLDAVQKEYNDFKATLNEKKGEIKAEMKHRQNDDLVQEDYEVKKTQH